MPNLKFENFPEKNPIIFQIKEAKLELQKKEYQNVLEELRKVMVTNEVNKCAVMVRIFFFFSKN